MYPIFQVNLISLKKVENDRGHLMEVQRVDDHHFAGFGQVYVTSTLPGITKAWYRHQFQLDQISIVSGHVLLVLFDSRASSPTYQVLQKIILSLDDPLLVQVPPGVWHGFKALGSQPAYLLHINSHPYDADHSDEERLPFDTDLIPYSWDEV